MATTTGPITTTDTLPPAIAETYAHRLLLARTRDCIHSMVVKDYTLPRGGGSTLKMRRRVPFDLIKAPLGHSGQTPPPKTMSVNTVEVTPEWYGTFTIINEQVIITGQDPYLNMAAEGLGQVMKESDDAIIRDVLAAGAASQKCLLGTNGDDPTNPTSGDLSKAYTTLRSNDAKFPFAEEESKDKFGTYPVRNSFFALCHTDLEKDLREVDGFENTINYPSQKNIKSSELGFAEGFRFFTSTLGSVSSTLSANNNTIYNILLVAYEAAGRVALEGNAKFYYNPPIDPMRQNCTSAVKWVQGTKVLNNDYLLRLTATVKNS